jgi:hypothetical protein
MKPSEEEVREYIDMMRGSDRKVSDMLRDFGVAERYHRYVRSVMKRDGVGRCSSCLKLDYLSGGVCDGCQEYN